MKKLAIAFAAASTLALAACGDEPETTNEVVVTEPVMEENTVADNQVVVLDHCGEPVENGRVPNENQPCK